MSALKRTLFVLLVAGLLVMLGNNLGGDPPKPNCYRDPSLETMTVSVGGRKFVAEVAQSPAQKTQGLSGRVCLDDDQAMIFLYETPGHYCYWMQDMRFPIDMIWLDDDKTVVTIHPNVSPESYPKEFCPEEPASYVIEVNSKTAKSEGWQKSTQFTF